ncbi:MULTISPECIES: twin-arginine translocase subunit TatC [Rufibacter]|uniref:Sec-independent protein translocase protein TatC n=1 Tax=Rufibacter quisquiliarum TaxID=1549639 RepID=A0A839GGV1_9BACT|nr:MULTISPECIES: twin-arginine translocase subunit TatC [Rufibacter]MBA9075899.1 sec-independent protein translocase protein TatC [Rufibacter quisquiliarum]
MAQRSQEVAAHSGEEHEMTFLDHLEVLRWHLIRSAIAIVVVTGLAFSYPEIVFHEIILGPSRTDFFTYRKLCEIGAALNSPGLCINELDFTLQSRELASQFTMHLTSSFVIGLLVGFPYLFWEIWRFIKPGLYPNEQKNSRGAVFFVSFLFLIGSLFGYFIVSPLSINFLASYQVDPSIANEFDLSSYVTTLVTLVLSCGIMFELPMIVFFLSRVGLVSPELMKLYRKHAIVVIALVAAILSPPDVLSMTLMGIPLLLLYEVSIHISWMVRRRDVARLNEQATS